MFVKNKLLNGMKQEIENTRNKKKTNKRKKRNKKIIISLRKISQCFSFVENCGK